MATKRAPKSPKAPVAIRHNTELPSVAQAANIGLVILKKLKKATWRELLADPQSHSTITISDEQRALLTEHESILPYLRVGTGVNQSVTACDTCRRYVFTDTTGAAKGRCTLSIGCSGQLHRASTIVPRT